VKIEVLGSGTGAPDWVATGFEVYQKRLPPECRLLLTECPIAKRKKGARAEDYRNAEAEQFTRLLKPGAYVIALDKSGTQIETEALSMRLGKWMMEYPLVQIMIGGPDGLSSAVLGRANWIMSLSTFTFPHFLVRILIAEQIYRAWSVLKNHPYHK
jgi:23S rRNA (pseudouridine1915-N3)-methyltransferase